MDHPIRLLERARRARRPAPQPLSDRAPAPQPVAPQAPAPSPAAAPTPAPTPAPRPTGGHALYTGLMRSHDRMGTRHLPGGRPS